MSGQGRPPAGHELARVVEDGDRYVLHCECGWSSPASASATEIVTVWVAHLVRWR